MAKYRVALVVTLYAGVIGLTKAQSAPRLHCLKHLKKNQFEIIEPISFKVGEVIDIPGKPDKALLQRLELVDKDGNPVGEQDESPPPPPPPNPPPSGGTTTEPNPNDPPPPGAGENTGEGDENTGDGDLLKPSTGDSGDE